MGKIKKIPGVYVGVKSKYFNQYEGCKGVIDSVDDWGYPKVWVIIEGYSNKISFDLDELKIINRL